MEMAGKVVVITGAGRGIGAQAARIFADAGAKLVLTARDPAGIAELAAQIGAEALAIAGDVSRAGDMEALVAATMQRWGRIDVLIGNAGVIEPIARIEDSRISDWDRVIDVNLKGIYHGIRAVLPVMIAQKAGTILTMTSGAAHKPVEGWSAYCASKAGAAILTQCVDEENRKDGIRAMNLSPGTVATKMQREIAASGINPVSKLDWSAHIPADWPARALLWMCSADADDHLGQEVALRDPVTRQRIGLD